MKELYSFTQLSKKAKADTSQLPEYRLAILGDCATQHLATALRGYASTCGINLNVYDADYNQILHQVMDPMSELYQHQTDSVLIYMCTEKLYDLWADTPISRRESFADTVFEQIRSNWDCISSRSRSNILQFTFCENNDYVFGNYACKQPMAFYFQLKKLNFLMMSGCSNYQNVFLVDLNEIQMQMGREQFHDPALYGVAKMPASLAALPAIAKNVLDVIQTFRGIAKKCVVLDLDNTLWGGVIGDDGLSGIQIGELGVGHAFSELQQWLRELKNRGILLAVCSKNEEAAAKEPFEKHQEMVLRLEDFSAFVANWEDKASNIRNIREMLNLGLDSFVFIDDNPFERELVRSLLPEVTVPELPADPALYLDYLKSLNLFETNSFSETDAKRTELYRAESQRVALQQQFADFDEYLESLEMVATAAPFDEFYTPRIAQLTQRSNQFNLRTVRCTEAEIAELAKDDRYITLYFTLKDKLTDHGLISLAIMEKRENKQLFIHNWLMSCRVLKRGMEEFIINKIVETARNNGFETIIGEYVKTPKNAMVEKIYERLGFTAEGDNLFRVDVNQFKNNKTLIKE